jgi:hypothetical protein
VTADQARARIEKLLALADPARGGTDNERAVALQKAQALSNRYGIGLEGERRAHTARQARSRARRPPHYAAPAHGPAFDFAAFMRTGKADAPGVKVHHYRNRGDWKIEIDL